jgi:hypothetical protein
MPRESQGVIARTGLQHDGEPAVRLDEHLRLLPGVRCGVAALAEGYPAGSAMRSSDWPMTSTRRRGRRCRAWNPLRRSWCRSQLPGPRVALGVPGRQPWRGGRAAGRVVIIRRAVLGLDCLLRLLPWLLGGLRVGWGVLVLAGILDTAETPME